MVNFGDFECKDIEDSIRSWLPDGTYFYFKHLRKEKTSDLYLSTAKVALDFFISSRSRSEIKEIFPL